MKATITERRIELLNILSVPFSIRKGNLFVDKKHLGGKSLVSFLVDKSIELNFQL